MCTGRVQSAALRLVCERETAIEAFQPREYWTVEVTLHSSAGVPFQARSCSEQCFWKSHNYTVHCSSLDSCTGWTHQFVIDPTGARM